jgi:hypothetical protein
MGKIDAKVVAVGSRIGALSVLVLRFGRERTKNFRNW